MKGRGSTCGPEREQETSFRGESQRTKLLKECVKGLYQKLSESIGQILEEFHYDHFKSEMGDCTTRT